MNRRLLFLTVVVATGLLLSSLPSSVSLGDAPAPAPLADFDGIIYPRTYRPAFVLPEDTLSVELFGGPGNYTVSLDPGNVTLPVEAVRTEGGNTSIDVTIPLLPEGLYRLTVSDGSNTLSQPRAVVVKESFEEEYHFVHITDLHIGADGVMEKVDTLKETLELLNPAFVVIGGDIIDASVGGNSTKEAIDFVNAFADFDLPTFAIPGNHETGYIFSEGNGLDDYRTYINPVLDYSFTYGDDLYLMVYTGAYSTMLDVGGYTVPAIDNNCTGVSDAQFMRMRSVLESHPDFRNGIVISHAPFENGEENQEQTMNRNRSAFEELCSHYGMDLILSGHTHAERTYDSEGRQLFGVLREGDTAGLTHAQTLSALNGGGNEGYRDVRVSDGSVIFTEDRDWDGNLDATSCVRWDDLTVQRNEDGSVRVENRLNRWVRNATVTVNTTGTFAMPEVFGGLPLSFTYGPNWTSALVSMDISPGERRDVYIADSTGNPAVISSVVDARNGTIVVNFDRGMYGDPDALVLAYETGEAYPSLSARHNWSAWELSFAPPDCTLEGRFEVRMTSPLSLRDYHNRGAAPPGLPVLDSLYGAAPSHLVLSGPDDSFDPWLDALPISALRENGESAPVDASALKRHLEVEPWTDFTLEQDSPDGALLYLDPERTLPRTTYRFRLRGCPGVSDTDFSLTTAADIDAPRLLSHHWDGPRILVLEFSEEVSGLEMLPGGVTGPEPVDRWRYVVTFDTLRDVVVLNASLVTDRAGHALDTDGDGAPGGGALEIAFPPTAATTTGSVHGICLSGDTVRAVMGGIVRDAPVRNGTYRLAGLSPGVWRIGPPGGVRRTVSVTPGDSIFLSFYNDTDRAAPGTLMVFSEEGGTVRVGHVEENLSPGGSVAFHGLAPGTYAVIFEGEDGTAIKTVEVRADTASEVSFQAADSGTDTVLNLAFVLVLAVALVALGVFAITFRRWFR